MAIKRGLSYMCFSSDTSLEKAKEKFVEKYHREPETVEGWKGLVWAGPITALKLEPQRKEVRR